MARTLKTKTCTAYARRAAIEGAKTNLSLEAIVRDIIKAFPDAENRKTPQLFDDQYTQLTDYELMSSGGVVICIDCHSPQNQTSMVQTKSKAQKNPKLPVSAKKGHSFVKYEAWAFIKGDELLIAGDMLKDYMFDSLIDTLAGKAKAVPSNIKVRTASVCVRDKIKQVQKYGVRQIELDISEYAHELEEATAKGKSKITKQFSIIKDILSCHDAENALAKSHVSYRLVVDVTRVKKAQLSKAADGNTKDPVEIWAKHAAAGVLEDYINDYTIHLRGSGGKIRKSELSVSRSIKVQQHGKSYSTKDMWWHLASLHGDLSKQSVF